MKSSRVWVALMASAAFLAVVGAPANAESWDTFLLNHSVACVGELTKPSMEIVTSHQVSTPREAPDYGTCIGAVNDTLNRITYEESRDAANTVRLAELEAQDADPSTRIAALLGGMSTQVASLTDLQWRLSFDFTHPRSDVSVSALGTDYQTGYDVPIQDATGCLCADDLLANVAREWTTRSTSSSGQDPDPADTLSKMAWANTAYLYWFGKDNSMADGKARFTAYWQTERLAAHFDFLSMSEFASPTPINGYRLKKTFVSITPTDHTTTAEEFAPTEVRTTGDNGTFTLSATLSGEGSVKSGSGSGGSVGASFGISRTWNVSAGDAGGNQQSDDNTWAMQSINGAGSRYPKSAMGVSTWKVPSGSDSGFYIHAHANLRK